MVMPQLSVNGSLEVGRHPATLRNLRATLVDDPQFATSISRRAIWAHFERANELLQSAVLVHSAWVGGSFTTSKLNPRDIDVVYVVNEADRAKRSDQDLRVVESFMTRVTDPLTKRRMPEHNLLVDSFIVNWGPYVGKIAASADYQAYAQSRGYWDDFWQRERTGGKKTPAVPADSIPRRGYLEVQFDGYLI